VIILPRSRDFAKPNISCLFGFHPPLDQFANFIHSNDAYRYQDD
jgi:hypothetical protein